MYGSLYHNLSQSLLEEITGIELNKYSYFLTKLYLQIFGYPDLAGNMRYDLIMQFLNLQQGELLLDVGSGNGIYTNQYAYNFKIKGVGLEGRRERVKIANRVKKELNLSTHFVIQNLERPSINSSQYDKIICIEVLEHIVHDKQLFKEMIKGLKQGGKIVITIPRAENYNPQDFKTFIPYEHVRNGYVQEFFIEQAKITGLKIVYIGPYFLFFTKYAVKIQQYLYKNLHPFFNILIYPFLLLISQMDKVIPLTFTGRGIIVVLYK